MVTATVVLSQPEARTSALVQDQDLAGETLVQALALVPAQAQDLVTRAFLTQPQHSLLLLALAPVQDQV